MLNKFLNKVVKVYYTHDDEKRYARGELIEVMDKQGLIVRSNDKRLVMVHQDDIRGIKEVKNEK